ncbi:MAG: type VI secretion system ImpA family N-terminal domain-containing protein, partial [Gemmatimonadota bacterium]
MAPIEGDTPAGPELRSSNEFAAIERAFLDADQPALMTPTGVTEEVGDEFELVVELATDFLRDQSKDLKVAVLLAVSLLRVEGYSGLATGLEVVKGLLDNFWD